MAATVVFSGGPTEPREVRDVLEVIEPRSVERVFAADSGYTACVAAGLHCDLLVGDMDSIPAELLAVAEASGTVVERHDPDKDATDLELALDHAVRGDGGEIIVIGSAVGRLDHLLATAALLGSTRYATHRIEAHLGRTRVVAIRDGGVLHAAVGTTASILALHGPVSGVTVTGMRWPLENALLDANSSVGVSNVFVADRADFAMDDGVLIVVVPDQREL